MKTLAVLLLLCIAVRKTPALFFPREVCYPPYGCFSRFPNTGSLPQSPTEIDVTFRLNNPSNTDLNNPDYLDPLDTSTLTNSHFDSSLNVAVIVHGFTDSVKADGWMLNMAEKLIQIDNVNTICVDWRKGADGSYDSATANTRLVGKIIAKLLEEIYTKFGVSYGNMHLVGHSLGSHISGYAGSALNGKVGKISGLDPAGLNFENYLPEVRLDPDDAVFVQAIHTDADAILELGWGMGKAIGDVDFYPNGGEDQPGCSKTVASFWNSLWGGTISQQVACSHTRAVDLFTSSINSCNFDSNLCSSYTNYQDGSCDGAATCRMGYWASSSCQDGKYYLTTTDTEPFC